MKVPPMPAITGLRRWLQLVRESVSSASSKPDAAFHWILAVESSTWEHLQDTEMFDTLDAKLHAALTNVLPQAWVGRWMVKTEESARLNLRARGR